MRRQRSFALLDNVPSATLNGWQDVTAGVRVDTDANGFTSTMIGADAGHWQGTLTNAAFAQIDGADWRDRKVSGSLRRLAAASLVGGSTDYVQNDPTSTSAPVTTFEARYLGRGAYSNVSTSAAVSNGARPMNGVGAVRSYAVIVDDLTVAGSVYLYCDPATGALCLYNDTGADLNIELFYCASGPTGLRAS